MAIDLPLGVRPESACAVRSASACETFARIVAVRRVGTTRTIVLGTFADGAAGVAILDARSGKRIDGFACFQPAISPDGTRIAFERYFTLGATLALRYRGLVAVYDLGKTPSGNRAPASDVRFPGEVVNPRAMTGDASERWVDGIVWHSPTELRFALRFDERTHDVSIALRPSHLR